MIKSFEFNLPVGSARTLNVYGNADLISIETWSPVMGFECIVLNADEIQQLFDVLKELGHV
jgi:hypothetical protein